MANEITASASLSFTKGNVQQQRIEDALKQITVSGTKFHRTVQNIGLSEEPLSLGDIATASLGYCYLRNLDSTNYVKVRPATGGTDMLKLKAGEFAVFRWMTGLTPYAIANTAACDVEIMLIED